MALAELGFQVVDLAVQAVEAFQDLVVVAVAPAGGLALDEERAAGLEDAPVDLVEGAEALAVGDVQQLGLGEQLAGESRLDDAARRR